MAMGRLRYAETNRRLMRFLILSARKKSRREFTAGIFRGQASEAYFNAL